jgi:hypothetical protein
VLVQDVIEFFGCFVCGGTSIVKCWSYGDVGFVELLFCFVPRCPKKILLATCEEVGNSFTK